MAEQATTVTKKRVTAGWFDLRYILATLFIIYGVITVVMGADPSQEALHKAGGWNLNLWTGVVMIIVSLLFAAWAWWRPVKVDVPVEGGDEPSEVDSGGH
jgi:uncharacterized membrane protein HdeD (DUF308 family)